MAGELDSKVHNQQRYGRFARHYVESHTHAKGEDLDRLLEMAHPQPGWIVLDIATGGGHTALHFAPHVRRVTAADLTWRMLLAARQHHRQQTPTPAVLEYTTADAEALPFAGRCFDLVTCRIASHHFPDPQRFIAEAARSLKSRGYLLVQDHVLPEDALTGELIDHFERTRDPSHMRAFSQPQWEAMYEQARLQVLGTTIIPKRHAFYAWAGRQGCSPDTIHELENQLASLPPAAQAWLKPRALGTPEASFVNHHLLILGQLS